MADVNGVLLWYQSFKKLFFIVCALLITANQVSSLICYCAGHCPSNQPNGSCFARPNSQCFSAVEQVYNPDTGLLEDERTYGCLPPEESGFMQCKGHLVPHQIPKSIACCSKDDWCNKYLQPVAVLRTTTPSPMYKGELMSYTGPYHLITFVAAVSVCSLILIVVIVCIVIRMRNQKANDRGYLDIEKKFLGGDAMRGLIDVSTDTSGSGSGGPLLVQTSIGKQVELLETIGRGHFGEVWKAQLQERHVAVKIFFTCQEASWARETDIYNTVLLSNENILRYVAADIRGTGSQTQMLLITDYMELGSLYDYLKVCMLDTAAMLKLARSASNGISHLHSDIMGRQVKPAIAHRDIKSRNILVKNDRTCVIADFGLAVKYKSDINELDVANNTRVGTRRYMPPEVLDETLDGSQFDEYKMGDMYSFALVLWEIARRCIVNGIVEEYKLPFHDSVPSDPSFADMKKVVCVDQTRPTIPNHWSSCPVMQKLSKTMEECWNQKPGARLNALRVHKTLCRLERQLTDEKFV